MKVKEVVVIVDGKPLEYISSAEFAQKCGVNKDTIRVWIARGKLESLKIGHDHWIKKDAAKPKRKNKRRERHAN